MTDLDLYSELMEEEVNLETMPDIPDSVRAYIQALQTKFAGMETELEALSTHVSRLESERTQLTASREKLMNNFSRLGLVGRREIGKLKQRVQYLAKKAHLPEPKFAVSVPTEAPNLNPENQLSYSELLSYLHSFQTPDKCMSIPQCGQVNSRPVPSENLDFKVVQCEQPTKTSIQQQQSSQQSSVDPHRRSPTASSSSSCSSGSESSGSSSSSSSSDSTGAPSRSASHSPNRSSCATSHSRVDNSTSQSKFDQRSIETRPASKKVTSPQVSHGTRPFVDDSDMGHHSAHARHSPQTTSHVWSKKRLDPVESRVERRFRPNSPFRQFRSYRRSDSDRLPNGHASIRPESSRGRSPNRSRSRERARPGEKYNRHARYEHTAPQDRKQFTERVDRTRQSCATTATSNNNKRGGESRPSFATSSSSSPKRARRPKIPSSDRCSAAGYGTDTQSAACMLKDKTSKSVRNEPNQQNAFFDLVEAQKMQQHLLGLVRGSVRQSREHHAARKMMQPSQKPLEQLIIVDRNRSPDHQSPSSSRRLDRHERSSTVGGKNVPSKSTTLYTQRLQSRLEESRADTTVPDMGVSEASAHKRQTPLFVDPGKMDQSLTESSDMLPDSVHSRNAFQEPSNSPATLSEPVCEPPLLPPQPSPILSEPVPLLSTTPILNHSYADEATNEPVNTSPAETVKPSQQPTSNSIEHTQRSPVANSNDNWSSFDEEVLFEANLPQCISPHTPAPDEYSSMACADVMGDEGNKEEGEVADELDEDDEELDHRSAIRRTEHGFSPRHQRSDGIKRDDRRSWSHSFHSGDTQTGHSNKRTGIHRSSSGSSPERQSTNRRQSQFPPHTQNRRLDPGGWRNAGSTQRIGTHSSFGSSERGGRRRSRSRSMSPLQYRTKTASTRHNDPAPRSPSRVPRVRTRTADHSPITIRDRNRSPSHRDPDSTVLGRTCDSSRSEPNHLGRASHGMARTERHAYHAPPRSPQRNNKARFNRDRDLPIRPRRPLFSQIHSRTSLNNARFRPRVHPGSSSRPGPRRF